MNPHGLVLTINQLFKEFGTVLTLRRKSKPKPILALREAFESLKFVDKTVTTCLLHSQNQWEKKNFINILSNDVKDKNSRDNSAH